MNIKKKNNELQTGMSKEKKNLNSIINNQNYGSGLRYTIICIISVILVVGINLLVHAMPLSIIKPDISVDKIYSISNDTIDHVSSLKQGVDIYYICEPGQEDKNTTRVLNLYKESGENIKLIEIDPAYSPEVVEKYAGNQTVENNSIIVVSEGKRQILKYNDYFSKNIFLLEDYLNGAIKFVTTDDLKKVYYLEGHGEPSLSNEVTSYMGLDGYYLQKINLIESGTIPEDASAIVLNGPTKDISENEAELLTSYMKQGGKMIILAGYSNSDFSNLQLITKYYGVKFQKGYVREGDEGRTAESNPTFIMPYIFTEGNESITEGVEYILMPNSRGIEIDDTGRKSLEITTILGSSESAISVYNNIFTSKSEIIEGPFKMGIKLNEAVAQGESKLILLSSGYLLDSSANKYVNGENETLFLNSICWLCAEDDTPSIHSKTISTQFIKVDSSSLGFWKIIIVIAVPAAVLIVGLIICLRRRRR